MHYRDFYQEVAPHYDQRFSYGPRTTRRQLSWLGRHCSQGPLLDLGCGTGRMLRPLDRAGYGPVGLDCSLAMLTQARKRHKRLPLVLADAAQPLPLADQSFQVVICLHATVSHLTAWEDLLLLGREVWRVLRPRGSFVLEVPHPASFPPPDPAAGWRSFGATIGCRSLGQGLELMRPQEMPHLETTIRVLGMEDLPAWLGHFSRIHLHPGFSEGIFDPQGGEVMVVRAIK